MKMTKVPFPASPNPFGDPRNHYFYTSTPSSPSRIAALYDDWKEEKEPLSSRESSTGFDFSFHMQTESEIQSPALAAADELFEGGMIRPLDVIKRERGRERAVPPSPPRRRVARSHSPMREKSPVTCSVLCKFTGSKKWKLKDLFLFRSASEGRATARGSEDSLRGHTLSSSSFNDKKASAPSPHEMHYAANKAATKEMKKKTPISYNRNNLFGYLRDNAAVKGIKKVVGGSSSRRPW